ncbi:MAG: methyl-accepting chemotaxis protein [Spirochaetaceae bacterium]|jgi:methyl-accepting chemotaxis protein|nr:methyl-accepting chemotaxis protein [Spirochaetaceae bacterium]
MKLKIQMTLIVFVIMTVVVVSVAAILLIQARSMQTQAVYENMENLTGYFSMRIQNEYENYLNVTKSVADIANSYHNVPQEERRAYFDMVLLGIMESNINFIGMFFLWKPDAIDNDADYIDTEGTDETGRYMTWYTRMSGSGIEKRPFSEYQYYEDVLANMDMNSPVLSNPYYKTVNGEPLLVSRICYPIISYDTELIVGRVGIVFNFESTIAIVDEIQPYETGRAMLYSNDGQIIAHPNPAAIGKSISDPLVYENIGQKLMEEINDGLRLGEPVLGYNQGNFFCSYPFYVGDVITPWNLVTSAPEIEVISSVLRLTQITIFIILGAVIVSAIIIFFTCDRITQPIVKISMTLKDISEGERDLTKTVNVAEKNEIGDLAKYFNATIGKIKDLVITIKNQSVTLFNIGNNLASNMAETAAAINQITVNIQSIKVRVMNQSASVTETNATMDQITDNIGKLNEHIEDQTSSVSQSSTAIEQMLANIQSVTATLMKNADNVKELAEASEVGRSGLQEVATDIQEIARESEGLLEINAVIENIASQTNLLSMNAAIEAAHAGEAGKGFAVVADEIRKLAESSAEQSQTIVQVLNKIKESIDKISNSTNTVINKFAAIDAGVKLVADQEENIRDAMEEQSEGSKQVLQAVSHMKEITDQVKKGSLEMLQGSKNVIHEGATLSMVTQEITNGMDEIARGTEQINIAVNQVNQISGSNKDNIDILVQEVSKFKIE